MASDMAIISLEDLRETNGALLGVDPGTKTLGLAISDSTRLIATPLKTIKREKFTLDAQLTKAPRHPHIPLG